MAKSSTRCKIRQQIRQKRRQLSSTERHLASSLVVQHLSRDPAFLNSRKIAFYFPNDGELDITALIHLAWAKKKTCYLPVLTHIGQNRLLFSQYNPDTRLIFNRFNIPEPLTIKKKRVSAQNIDLIFTPLVAFDINGNRLGMGGGFYDRTLQFLKYRKIWRKPRLVGIAYDFQKVASLKHQPWDIPLDKILTEKNQYVSSAKDK